MLGAFLAQDLALFVAFFDLMLIPFYFLIGFWGGPKRVRGHAHDAGHLHARRLAVDARCRCRYRDPRGPPAGHITFVLSTLVQAPAARGLPEWIFLFFAAAFLVKMPAFPLHGWMHD